MILEVYLITSDSEVLFFYICRSTFFEVHLGVLLEVHPHPKCMEGDFVDDNLPSGVSFNPKGGFRKHGY